MRGSGVGFHYVPRRHHFLREDITMAAGGAAELLLGMNCSFCVSRIHGLRVVVVEDVELERIANCPIGA